MSIKVADDNDRYVIDNADISTNPLILHDKKNLTISVF